MKKRIQKIILMLSIVLLVFSTVVYAKPAATEKIEIDMTKLVEKLANSQDTEESFDYNITIVDSMKRSTYNTLLTAGEVTGNGVEDDNSDYNLREEFDINVKNQRRVGACWAFSYTSVLETTLANKYNRKGLEYSPIHMEYVATSIYNKQLGAGGSQLMMLAYNAGGFGPVYETEFPFDNVYDESENSEEPYYLTNINNVNLNQIAKDRIIDATIYANIYKEYGVDKITYKAGKDSDVEYSKEEVQAIRERIKKQIKENGAVTANFYSDMGTVATGEYISMNGYYNPDNYYFYCDNNAHTVNHAVTIVGWDDSIRKEDFAEGHQPLNDGAYIVLNSWGSAFGDNGYFYVSYDDAWIEYSVMGLQGVKKYNENVIENIYQYDELGANIQIPLKVSGKVLTEIEAANVYTRKDINQKEYITEVGVFLLSTQGIEVYVNAESGNLKKTTLVATATGQNALEPGYHVLKLSSPLELTGEKFVVKVKYINSETAWLPLECNLYENGYSTTNRNYDTAKSNRGESYVLAGTTWVDICDIPRTATAKLTNTNAAIKAFTTLDTTVYVEGIKLNKKTLVIDEGTSSTLAATVTPEDATNPNIIWTSSDENVATVENGVVTGGTEGVAIITAATEDGNFTDICTVTVEKKIINVTGVSLNKGTETIKEGQKTTLVATVSPEDATNPNVIWESSNNDIATVENGEVTGIAEGIATITVKTQSGNFEDSCVVTVEKLPPPIVGVTGVELDEDIVTIKEGEEMSLVATVSPEDATNQNLIWESSADNIAIVEDGLITGVSEGMATITVTTEDGNYEDSCMIIVEKLQLQEPELPELEQPENPKPEEPMPEEPEPEQPKQEEPVPEEPEPEQPKQEDEEKESVAIEVDGVTLDKTELVLEIGEKTNLVATINPLNATNRKVKWSSSNEKVATITEQGIITAVAKGTTEITVTTENGGFSATCILNVNEKLNTDDDIYKEQHPGEQLKDSTIANTILPNAGIKITIIMIVVAIIVTPLVIKLFEKFEDDYKGVK